MSELIDKEVYVQLNTKTYGYGSELEWVKGAIKGRFMGGDVIVEADNKVVRANVSDVAFVVDKEVPLGLATPLNTKEEVL